MASTAAHEAEVAADCNAALAAWRRLRHQRVEAAAAAVTIALRVGEREEADDTLRFIGQSMRQVLRMLESDPVQHAATRATRALAAIRAAAGDLPPADVDEMQALVDDVTAETLDACVIFLLSELHLACLLLLQGFDAHMTFWRERAEYAPRYGPALATFYELMEGGPVEWVERLRPWSAGLAVAPPETKLARLRSLRQPLLYTLGTVKRALASVAAARTPAQLDAVVTDGRTLLTALLALPPPGGSVLGQSRSLPHVLEWTHSATCRITELSMTVRARMEPLLARSALRRHWLRWTLLAVAAVGGCSYLARNHRRITEFAREAGSSLALFYNEHVAGPLGNMVDELVGARKLPVADPAALEDAKASLAAMLAHFNARIAAREDLRLSLSPDLQKADLAALARALDMRPVSERFTAEIRAPIRNVIAGDLAELMLIQIAFIKKELLSVMSKVDEILDDNQFNLQVSAMLPAVLILYGGSRFLRSTITAATAPLDTTDKRMSIRLVLRDVHRLLTMAQRQLDASTAHVHAHASPASVAPVADLARGFVHASPAEHDTHHGSHHAVALAEIARPLWSETAWVEASQPRFGAGHRVAAVAEAGHQEDGEHSAAAFLQQFDVVHGARSDHSAPRARAGTADSAAGSTVGDADGLTVLHPPSAATIRALARATLGDRTMVEAIMRPLRIALVRFRIVAARVLSDEHQVWLAVNAPWVLGPMQSRALLDAHRGEQTSSATQPVGTQAPPAAAHGGAGSAERVVAAGAASSLLSAPASPSLTLRSPQSPQPSTLRLGSFRAAVASGVSDPLPSIALDSAPRSDQEPVQMLPSPDAPTSPSARWDDATPAAEIETIASPSWFRAGRAPIDAVADVGHFAPPTPRASAAPVDASRVTAHELFTATGHTTLYPGLRPDQLGLLLVLLRKLAHMLAQLRERVNYGEWIRATQDLHDISASGLTEAQRIVTVERVMSSYAFLAVRPSDDTAPLMELVGL